MIVVCNGMYRSGSTLQHKFAASLLEYKKPENLGFLDSTSLSNRRIELETKACEQKIYILKTHSSFPKMSGDVRIVYCYRDLRDVAVSLYAKMSCNRDRMRSLLSESVSEYYLIHKNETFPVLSQSYDRLVTDSPGCLSELATFLNVEISPQQANSIAEKFSLEAHDKNASNFRYGRELIFKANRSLKISRALKAIGFSTKILSGIKGRLLNIGDGSGFHINHVSKNRGKSGIWVDQLSNEDLIWIEREFSEWLRMNKYVLSGETYRA